MSVGLRGPISRCETLVARYRELSGAPTVVVAITDARQTLETLAVGDDPARLQALGHKPVPIGSITKTLAALGLLRVAALRGIVLSEPVGSFLPEFATPQWRSVQLVELLTHTSGLSIGSLAAPWSRQDLRIGTALPHFADMVGRFYYSNLGYEALGRVLERLDDHPFGEVLARHVLRPLGLERAIGQLRHTDHLHVPPGFAPDDSHSLHWVGEPLQPAVWEAHSGAAGGSAASLDEVARLLRDLLGAEDGPRAVFADEWRAAIAPRVACEPGVGYGFGIFRDQLPGRDRVFHAGGMIGHRTLAMADRRSGMGVVVLTDLGGPLRGSLILRLGHGLLDVLAGADVADIAYPPRPAAAMAGSYVALDGDGLLAFEEQDGSLVLRAAGGSVHPLQWTEADRCLCKHGDWREFEFRLVCDPSGAVARVLHGSRVFVRDAAAAARGALPQAIAGLYRSRNPWASRVRVTDGTLGPMIHVAPLEGPLVVMDGGCRRVAGTPEVVRFGEPHDGVPQVLDLSGAPYVREDR
jgi:CubicO group peptidase (beta-lactamase class C family)